METINSLCVPVDVSIWMFQIREMENPGRIRPRAPFNYQLCQLVQLNLGPLFVFDSPYIPPRKRHRDTPQFCGQTWESQQVKRVFLHFGFLL